GGPARRAARRDRARHRRQEPARPRRQEIEEPHSLSGLSDSPRSVIGRFSLCRVSCGLGRAGPKNTGMAANEFARASARADRDIAWRRDGVKWHDGKPFTAKDVKCTFDLLLGTASEKLRLNPRKPWYRNLDAVVPKGDYEVSFQLKRPQPAFIALLASGFTPIYPCHVPAREMRQHPIGTGPFKFVEFKPNEYIKVVRNPDYWKKERPYLDGIDWTIIKNQATGQLAFLSGQFDITSPYFFQVPLINDTQKQDPQAICKLVPSNVNRNVMINRTAPPFNNPELRRAVALTIDRRAFIDTLTQGKGDVGGAMLPPPEGIWGMPPEMVKQLPGYDPDVEKSRAAARQLMEKNGYGPDKRLAIKVSTRNIPPYRDPAVILIDQLKQIYIDAELDPVDS